MCGIAGFVHPRPRPEAAPLLARMVDALAHRGPDGRGFYLEDPLTATARDTVPLPGLSRGSTAPAPLAPLPPEVFGPSSVPTHAWHAPPCSPDLQLGLASRRLAIVDRAGGRQPVFSESGGAVAVFNGELYNYRALQDEVRARGHRLSTDADSEVLVHLYEAFGIDGALARLHGMFAFALWDRARRVLYLARDRLGEKPLYYSSSPDGLRFASELKGLLVLPEVRRDLDPGSLARYLIAEAVPAPRAIYREIHQLEPGTCLAWREVGLEQRRYWSLPDAAALEAARDTRRAHASTASDAARLDRLEQLLRDSVRARLMGEVPVGVMLSGGLDSSLVAAMMAREMPLRTFSVGFRERSFDESGPAALVARHLGAEHHPLTVTAVDLPRWLEDIQRWLDEPLADGSLIPTTALTRHVRRHGVVVALSGDGGDEAFGGYPTYLAHRLDPLWDRVPGRLAALGTRLSGRLPSSFDDLSLDFKLRRLLAGIEARGVRRHALWMAGLMPDELLELLTPEVREALRGDDLFSELEPVVRAVDGHRWPETAQIQDLMRYLPDDLLVKTDRASMSGGLEVRAPLLDHAVVTAGLELPAHLKVAAWQTKVALRRIGRRWLPASILERPKKGFGMPTAWWLRELPATSIEAWLKPPEGQPVLFEPGVLARWAAEHRSGRRDHRKRLWPVIMLELWRRGPWGPR